MSDLEIVKLGKRTFTVLFPDIVRPLTESELITLRKDIRKRGVVVPVVVDEDDGVIDGANRLRIAREVGLVSVPTSVRKDLDHEQKAELALTLNEARRHLTVAERAKLKEERTERVAAARREGKSLRTIAEEEGVSEKQVRKDIVAASTADQSAVEPPGGKVTGKDGKKREATRPAAKKPPEPKPEPKPAASTARQTARPEPAQQPLFEAPPPKLDLRGLDGLKTAWRLAASDARKAFAEWIFTEEAGA